MTVDKSEEARRGLFDSVAGKAKEVAGAVTGNSDLAEEGQLQQADAQARKEANSREAIADASARQAAEELREKTQDAAKNKHDAYTHAEHQEQAAARDAAVEKARAETDAVRQEIAGRRQAEFEADAKARASATEAAQLAAEATLTERNALEEQDRLESEAADAERRAAALRAETNSE